MTTGDMAGRVVVITGGNSGIGYEISRGVAARGGHVVIVARGAERAREAAGKIQRVTGTAPIDAVGVTDLASRAEWAALSNDILDRFPQVHVLVNNAGAVFLRREITADGFERTFALNVLAPLAVTTRLTARLRSSAPARVVNVASSAHVGQTVDFADLQGLNSFPGTDRGRPAVIRWGSRNYGRSKLDLILLSREMARRLSGTGVTVNAVHPGFIRSGFGQNNGGGSAFVLRLVSLFAARGVRAGAKTPIRVACDPDLAAVTGEYFAKEAVAPGSPASRDPVAAKRLYEECMPLTELPPLPDPAGPGAV